ncbi:hypothetical protein DFQ29_008436, partial [Apophysomyces sp. BC1021]
MDNAPIHTSEVVANVLQSDDHEDHNSKLEKEQLLLPRPFTLTAEKMNEVTFSRRFPRKRERKKM